MASIWRTVAVGRVASNKARDSKDVTVIPMEWMSMTDGEVNSNPTTMSLDAPDSEGVAKKASLTSDLIIKATWLPGTSNRLTAPDVRRGERVEIFQSGDADKFYWKTTGLDDNLRKLETIVIGISATTKEGDTTLTKDNMYWIELSSHSKTFCFKSSKQNGEPYIYTMAFNMDVGEFFVQDDIGNFINLVSKTHLIHMQNVDGTFIKIDMKDIKAFAPQDILADAKRNIVMTAGTNIDLKAGVMARINGGGSILTLIGASTTLKTPVFIGTR